MMDPRQNLDGPTVINGAAIQEENTLRDYLRIVWRRRWLIALAVAVAAGSALGFSTRRAPVYVAKAKVFIGPRTITPGNVSGALEELTFSREFMASYVELMKSRPLAERVVEKASLPFTPTQLIDHIETRLVTDTRIIEVSVSDNDAGRAERTANTLVETFVTEDIEDFGGGAGVEATVLEPALRPTVPVSPKPLRDGLLGAALGLALGIGAAFLIEQLDTRLRSREDVERTMAPLPVLAAIPTESANLRGRKLFLQQDPKSPNAEALRILRTNVQFFGVESPMLRVLVTSPYAEEGKTTVAVNLAASLADAGVKTLLIEADLRRPVAHTYFDTDLSPGISEILRDGLVPAKAIRHPGSGDLFVLTAGTVPPNPSELLGTQRMHDLLEESGNRFQAVIIDTPPALAVADATVIARQVDGIILVIRAGQTHRVQARETKALFERMGARVLGVVLNDVNTADAYLYYRYYHGYAPLPPRRSRRRRRKPPAWSPGNLPPEMEAEFEGRLSVEPVKFPPVETHPAGGSEQPPRKESKPGSAKKSAKLNRSAAEEIPPSPFEWTGEGMTPPPNDEGPLFLLGESPNQSVKTDQTRPQMDGRSTGEVPSTFEGYCIRCRSARIVPVEELTESNGQPTAKGSCPVCGITVYQGFDEEAGPAKSKRQRKAR
jgi:capsular exopolysaccharide synthesis family protein